MIKLLNMFILGEDFWHVRTERSKPFNYLPTPNKVATLFWVGDSWNGSKLLSFPSISFLQNP
jgi:hypothetical protein